MATLLKINIPPAPYPKVLVAPLDWGLGHATRCIPIIKELLILKYEVWIAASGPQKTLLKEEFPLLSFVELPGYQIRYGKNRAFTYLGLVGSIPKILIRIKEENHWLQRFRADVGLDAVISDNRYGLWGRDLYCVLITHQLGIRSSLGAWMDRWVQRLHYRLIGRFSACWVPDVPEGSGIAGELSHPVRMPGVPTRYIGILSRMAGGEDVDERVESDEEGVDLLILLSGPEPQRSILEKMLWEQLESFLGKVVFVRGMPMGGNPMGGSLPDVAVYDHLPAAELNELLLRAKLVVARAGYSTVMDIVRLKKKTILIPTPGQTEQEYLGEYLMGRGAALCMRQSGFSLRDALLRAGVFSYTFLPDPGDDLLRAAVNDLLYLSRPSI